MKTTDLITSQLKSSFSVTNRERFLSKGMQKAFFTLFVLFFALNTSAQTLQEYGTMITAMKASSDPAIVQQAGHLDSLMFQVQPKIHITNFVLQLTGGTVPVCLETDDESVGMLSGSEPLFQTVELITVRLNGPGDLTFVLNLASLPGFQNLKYVKFLCSYQCDPESINALFTANNPALTVFYHISIPN